MSDGPYKTLPMRPKWKALSMRADNPAFTAEQVADAVRPALAADWSDVSAKLLNQLRAVLSDGEAALFPDHILRAIEGLRAKTTGALEATLVEAAHDAVSEGRTDQDALEQAVSDALLERGLRGIRQVEEHWLREAGEKRSGEVRQRLEAAIAGAGISDLARSLLGGAGQRALQPAKNDGLDEGVSL